MRWFIFYILIVRSYFCFAFSNQKVSCYRKHCHMSKPVKTRSDKFIWDPTIARRVSDIAAPALLGLALDPLLSIVDSIVVGQQSTIELAAIGLNTFILTFALFICGAILSTATGPLVAEKRAAGCVEEANELVDVALVVAVGLGIILTAALQLGAEPLLGSVMGGSGEVLPIAVQFLRLRALAAPAVFICSVGGGAFRGRLDTKTPLRIALLANSVNLGLDWVFVIAFGWGASGAACATGIAEWISAASFVYALKNSGSSDNGSKESGGELLSEEAGRSGDVAGWQVLFRGFSGPQFKELVAASGPIFLRTFLLQLALTAAAAAAARSVPSVAVSDNPAPPLSTFPVAAAVSAHQILSSLWLFISFALDSFAIAAQALVADARGRGDAQLARQVSLHALAFGLGVGLVFALLFQTVPAEVIVGVFSSDPAVVATAAPVLTLWLTAALPLNGIVFVGDGVMQGYRAFEFEAKAMLFATAVAAAAFIALSSSAFDPSSTLSQHGTSAMLTSSTSVMSSSGHTNLLPFSFAWEDVQHYVLNFQERPFSLGNIWCSLVVLQAARAASFTLWFFAPWGMPGAEKDMG
mmetsp:Transcript_42975/g.86878  ORF Transcript_42975/g.86878 Transcript_42975/m.86878 type:complete len:582 (-) Transcript_42975:501-2246(-)